MRAASWRSWIAAACAATLFGVGTVARAHFGPYPISLQGVPAPPVPGLTDGPDPIVVDEAKAIALGKALFWDVGVGSDGVACATCHFHAGADARVKNQLAPIGKDPADPGAGFDPDPQGGARGANHGLARADFPFHRTDDPMNPLGQVLWTSDDVVSSSGSFGGAFEAVAARGSLVDACARAADPVFHAGSLGTRRVEPRNAPTVVNAVFNFRNLWDGAANNVFNGSSAWGDRDPDAGVWVRTPEGVEKQRLRLENASLASQALAPPQNDVEMSCNARRFADLGRKLACRRPLETQNVAFDDGVLGPLSRSTPWEARPGLDTTYQALIREAFAAKYWSSEERSAFGAPAAPGAAAYSQLEANFALFFALSIQLYESTLVSDDAPFDRSARDDAGVPIDLSPAAQRGFTLFRTAHCGLCHIGPLFTPAAIVTNADLVASNPEAFGNETFTVPTTRNVVGRTSVVAGPALVDTGFASNGVTRDEWDRGLGGVDPFGNPLSFAEQYLQWLAGNPAGVVDPGVDAVRPCDFEVPIARDVAGARTSYFTQVEGVVPQAQDTTGCFLPTGAWLPAPAAAAAELASPTNTKMRSASVGSFKIPTLRNVELTGPYMHNGGMATLDEVVEFYTRGGNFDPGAKHFGTVFPQVELRHSASARADLVAFLTSLTDERVRFERAPFDHPELRVPHGHAASSSPFAPDLAADEVLWIPAVGAGGRSEPLLPFDAVLDACNGGCSDAVPLFAAAAPPPDDPACPVPEPPGAGLAALAALFGAGYRRRAKIERRPLRPLRSCSPRESSTTPDPSSRSRVVLETSTSPGPASAATRAAAATPMPRGCPPTICTSLVWMPTRTRIPSSATAGSMRAAARTAFAAPSKSARNPSPVVAISRPQKRSIAARIRTLCSWSTRVQA